MGPSRVIGIESNNLCVCHVEQQRSNVRKNNIRMVSPAEKEMREIMMRLGAEDPNSRKHMDLHQDNKI